MSEVKVLEGNAGQELTLTLPGGGGTGYIWEPVAGLPSDTKIQREFLPPSGIGGMGTERMKLTFSAPGEHLVTLGFTSPAGDASRVEQFSFKIK
jgi:predicted secreted protein